MFILLDYGDLHITLISGLHKYIKVFFFPRDKFFCARDTARKKLPVTLLHTRDTTVKCYPWHPWQTVVNPIRDTRDKTINANSELLDFFKVF